MNAKRWGGTLVFLVVLLAFSATALAAGILAKNGMRGDSVHRVQLMLIDQGYLKGGADGICGGQTVAAIRHFQRDHQLAVDGVCGEQTFNALKKNTLERKPPSKEAPMAALPPVHKGQVVYVEATAYSALDPGNGSTTASGTPVRHGVIAVDPSFIPLGSRVFIPGYGEAVAEDIGGAIIGNRIDVAFDTHEEALEFGRQELEIYILEYGG